MQGDAYRIYLYAPWFIANAARALLGLSVCVLLALYSTHELLIFIFIVLMLVAFSIFVMNLIPLFQLRKPCIVCTEAGIQLQLQLQLKQKNGNSYLGTLQEFIPWEHVHGMYLVERKSWYSLRGTRLLRINYSHYPGELQASHYCEIFLKQLDVHAESMYNVMVGMYSKYKR